MELTHRTCSDAYRKPMLLCMLCCFTRSAESHASLLHLTITSSRSICLPHQVLLQLFEFLVRRCLLLCMLWSPWAQLWRITCSCCCQLSSASSALVTPLPLHGQPCASHYAAPTFDLHILVVLCPCNIGGLSSSKRQLSLTLQCLISRPTCVAANLSCTTRPAHTSCT